MYATTNEYKSAILQSSRTTRVSGIIGQLYIDNDDIVSGSLSISSQCVDSNDLTLGAVYDSEMCISIYYDKSDYQKLSGKVIQLYFGILDANNEWQTIPLGLFEIIEAKRTMTVVKLRARDNLIHFDHEFIQPDTESRTPYNWLVYICEQSGITLGMTEDEMNDLPNKQAYPMDLSVISTYRNAISYLATISGCFAYIDRLGRLRFKQLKLESPVMTIPQDLRQSTIVEDNELQYTALTMSKDDKQYGAVVSGEGKSLGLGNMPLLESFGSEQSTYENACQNILADFSTVKYAPFTVRWAGDPSLDVGDWVKIDNVNSILGNQITSIITNHTWVYRGFSTIKAVGTIQDVNTNNTASPSQNAQNITRVETKLQNYATKEYVDKAIAAAQIGNTRVYSDFSILADSSGDAIVGNARIIEEG